MFCKLIYVDMKNVPYYEYTIHLACKSFRVKFGKLVICHTHRPSRSVGYSEHDGATSVIRKGSHSLRILADRTEIEVRLVLDNARLMPTDKSVSVRLKQRYGHGCVLLGLTLLISRAAFCVG